MHCPSRGTHNFLLQSQKYREFKYCKSTEECCSTAKTQQREKGTVGHTVNKIRGTGVQGDEDSHLPAQSGEPVKERDGWGNRNLSTAMGKWVI